MHVPLAPGFIQVRAIEVIGIQGFGRQCPQEGEIELGMRAQHAS